MIDISYDDREVQAALSRLVARVGNVRPVMTAIGGIVRDDIMERFDTSTAPDGKRWKPITWAAIVSRARRHAPKGMKKRRNATLARFSASVKPLLDTGALRNSIRVTQVTESSVTVSAGGDKRDKIAAVHHFGGQAGRGRRVHIPARPYMGVSPAGKADILAMIRRHLEVA